MGAESVPAWVVALILAVGVTVVLVVAWRGTAGGREEAPPPDPTDRYPLY